MHLSVGGDEVQIRISNQYAHVPLEIAAVHVALRSQGSGVGSDRAVTFDGKPDVSVPAGAVWISDRIEMQVADSADLAVSLYFEKPTYVLTQHTGSLQTNFITSGNHVSDASIPSPQVLNSYPFVSGIDVWSRSRPALGTVVALGDSITDGYSSHQDTNHRWSNLLADRLIAAHKQYGVANVGISANRLLHDGAPNAPYAPGANALARFDSDVLAQSGVSHVIVLEGINDLGHPGQSQPMSESVSPEDLEAAFQQLTVRAHAHGIRIYICTILPFEGTPYPGYFTAEKEAKRQAVNEWLLANRKRFDAVIDLDRALRDPEHPTRLLPAYDSGDHLHPSDSGMKAIADTIPLELF